MHVEFLIEEPSSEVAIQNIARRILPADISFALHPHQGKSDLLKNLRNRLLGYHRNHTLMQTIARANRVFRNKINGLIVDYVGVFRNLQKALAIYGSGSGGGLKPGETPVKDKQELVELLRAAISGADEFCAERWVDLPAIRDAAGFTRVKLLDDAVEAIVENDESKEQYRSLTNNVTRLYKAILPDPLANEFGQINLLLSTIQDKIQALTPVPDISDVLARVEDLLDESIASEGYVILMSTTPAR